MDDESFSDRVKNTLGSLLTSIEPSSLSNPLWSLTGPELENREWRRIKDTSAFETNPCSYYFDDFLSHARKNFRRNFQYYRKELDDDIIDSGDDKVDDGGDDDGSGGDLNDWDFRASIGLDSTLDNEEEDTYDKVAIDRENAGNDRLYMRDITDNHESHFGSLDDLPKAIRNKQRDPRANLWAARIRLKEDDAEAAEQAVERAGGQAPPSRAENVSSASGEDGDKVKPILIRKEHESTLKPCKCVRFDPGCTSGEVGGGETVCKASSNLTSLESGNGDSGSLLDESVSRVTDYVQNPS